MSTRMVFLVPLMASLAACGSTVVTLRGGEHLNETLSEEGKATPTTVPIRIYQLKSDQDFLQKGFDYAWNLWDPKHKDETSLDSGDVEPAVRDPKNPKDLIYKSLTKNFPDEAINPATRFIGVAALFTPPDPSKVDQTKWKKVVPLDSVNDWIFELDEYELKMIPN